MRTLLILIFAVFMIGCSNESVEVVNKLQTRDISDQYSVPVSECEAYTLPANLSYDRIIDRFNGTGEDAGSPGNSATKVTVAYGSELGGSIAIGRLLRGEYVDVRYSVELWDEDTGELIEVFCVRPGFFVAFHPIKLKIKGKPGTQRNFKVGFPDYPEAPLYYFTLTK